MTVPRRVGAIVPEPPRARNKLSERDKFRGLACGAAHGSGFQPDRFHRLGAVVLRRTCFSISDARRELLSRHVFLLAPAS